MTRAISFIAILLAASVPAVGQPTDVTIDGVFDEWRNRSPIYSDRQDQSGEAIDFGRLWADNDDRFVYLSVEVGLDEISLQNGDSITLYLDTDNDSTTGQPISGIGAELIWIFGSRRGVYVTPEASVGLDHANVGLISAPTVTSDRFELALDLHADPFSLGLLFPSDTVGVVFEATTGGDILPDPGDRAFFVIDRAAAERPYSYDLSREDESDLRILSWNVERDGFFESRRTRAYEQILNAVDPDVIGFTEIIEHTVAQTLDRLETLLPSGPAEQWFGSGSSWDIVVASRRPITRSFDLIRGSAGGYLIDLSDMIGSDLFLVVAHLKCCGGVAEDRKRQGQIDQVMAFIRDSKLDGTLVANTPIVIVGDMNFVGDSQQQKTLTDGDIVNVSFGPSFDPDWDNSPLTDAMPLVTGMPATFTWPGRGEDFSPGRLDYVVYTDFVLEGASTFALNTRRMPSSELQRLGLNATDTIVASDHLPMVTDFSALNVTSSDPAVELRSEGLRILSAYPNPAAEMLRVEFVSSTADFHRITVFDLLGREVREAEHVAGNPGRNVATISMSGLPAGMYFVEIRSGSISRIRAVTVKPE